jgi:hypothetical protein
MRLCAQDCEMTLQASNRRTCAAIFAVGLGAWISGAAAKGVPVPVPPASAPASQAVTAKPDSQRVESGSYVNKEGVRITLRRTH